MSADNVSNQLQPESRNLGHSLARQGHKLCLSSSLLVTTELEPLVKGFVAEARALVPCEGIEYVNDERGILVRDGEICRHRCRYTLKIRDEAAGKMLFTRGRRFNKDELAMLESLLAELLRPLRRALMHQGAPESRSGREDKARVPSHPRRQGEPTTAAPRHERSAVAPQTPRLSLVPLGGDGDYPSELTESLPPESEPSPLRSRADSLFASTQRVSAFGSDGSLDLERRALLAESIIRSGIREQELFEQAREVLGYFAYSDEALALMERLASAARDLQET